MDFRTLIEILGTFMPIVRLDQQADSYLIGTEVKELTVRNQDCMLSVGGRLETVQEYYD